MRKSVSMGLVAGVLGMGVASAEIKVSDALSLSGFIDMSAGANLPDGSAASYFGALDQFELDFSYKFAENLTAQADLNYLAAQNYDPDSSAGVTLEQAYLTYTAGPLAITAGKFLSASGFEAAEPTGLYQYSYSSTLVYGGYMNGVSATYTVSPMIALYGAVVGSVWDGADADFKEPGYELQAALMPMEGVTVKAGYFGTDVGAYTQSLINVWGMYSAGPLTAAAEVNLVSNWTAEDDNGLGYLVMANFKLSDKLGITGRYSALDTDADGLDNEVTVSPGYAISGSWFVLAEAKYMLEAKGTALAVESILTF